MIQFGPSGTCAAFTQAGYTHTVDAAAWVRNHGLDCFEYSFGRGVRLKEDTAKEIGAAFAREQVELSVHAPYFINLATEDADKAQNNHAYIFDSLQALRAMGGKRCVFHPGSPLKLPREQAMDILMRRWEEILMMKQDLGYADLMLCPETMGKKAQLGNLEEIIRMCQMDATTVPCIDWGHLNSRDCGVFATYDDYRRVLDRLIEAIGFDRTSHMHVHFSKIQYTDKGELRHLTFEDMLYGPPYEPLMQAYCDYRMEPYIVCESAGTQTVDAAQMKACYTALCKQGK